MRVKYFLTTLRGLESLVASRLREKAMGEVHLWERFPGILLLISEASMENILDAAYEIERATPIYRECRATLDEIVSNGIAVAREHLNPTEKFAVRTQRRGQHEFTSQDVNQRLGAAIVEVLGNPVELTYPDKIIRVEIVSEWVGIGVDTARAHKYLGKHDVRELLHRISVIQMPYTGEGADRMGIDIGRAAQTFEIREYIVAPSQPIPLSEVMPFLEGIHQGINMRYAVQRKAYPFPIQRTQVLLYELYQAVHWKAGQPSTVMLFTSTLGRPVSDVRGELVTAMKGARQIVVLAGAREGLPTGLMRVCHFALDLMPKVTFATEHVIPVTLATLANVIMDAL